MYFNSFLRRYRLVRRTGLRLINLAIVLAMVISLFPWNINLPGPLPDLGPEEVSAHNLDASAVYVFFDKNTQNDLDARIAGGWTPGNPLFQLGDELGMIIKIVPNNGTDTGVGGYTTFYVPNGLQVLDAAFVIPGTDPSDGLIDWDKIPAKGQALIPNVGAGGGPTTDVTGLTRGPNIAGVTAKMWNDANVNNGTLPGVYGDLGIFYSTDPNTAFNTYGGPPLSLKNNSGDQVGWRTILQNPMNRWDAWQMQAYGIAGTTNPAYSGSPVIDSNGRGNTGWGLANVVAGPQSGYAWEFDKAKYDACDPLPYSPSKSCIDQATQDIGPWQRIKYPGSQIAFDVPGDTTAGKFAGGLATDLGFDLTTGDLPLTTDQANNTPNAVRWAFGQLTLNAPEYAWIKVKVHNYNDILDAAGCPVWYVDTFGGDAGGDSNGKDHIWRYYDPNSVKFNGCLAIGKPATKEVVKVGDTYQYKIKLYHTGNVNLSNVVVEDTLGSGVTFLSAVPAQDSGPNPLRWNNIGLLAGDLDGLFEPGEMFEAVVTVKASGSGVLANEVCATGTTTPGGQTVNSCGKELTPSGNIPLLSQKKSVTPTAIAPGGAVDYTLTVDNIGSGPTGNPVVITEQLPPNFTYTSLISAKVNGATITGSVTVNTSNPNKPVFTIPSAINAEQKLELVFKATSSPTIPVDSNPNTPAIDPYCNSFITGQNGINQTTGALACVKVGGSSISDFIWRDWNGNGVQDAGEEGLPGVTVNVYAGACPPSGGVIGSAVTNSSGNYLINGLLAGTYCTQVPAPGSGGVPTGYTLTGDPDGGAATLTYTTVLAENETRTDVDFGYKPGGTGGIGDTVFDDIGNDGVQNVGDPGIPDVRVCLYADTNSDGVKDVPVTGSGTEGSSNHCRSTDASGIYNFTGLAQGLDYVVEVDTTDLDLINYFFPNGFSATTPNPHEVDNLTGVYNDADFGFFEQLPSSIGDTVCLDVNQDKLCTGVDTGISSVTVWLYRDDNMDGVPDPGELFKTTSTGPGGTYSFPNLGPARYIVLVDALDPDLPVGLRPSITEHIVDLPVNTNRTDIDFPFQQLLAKAVDKSFAVDNEELKYTIDLNYEGSDLFEDLRVTDPLPQGVTYVPASANMGGVYGAYSSLAGTPGFDDQTTYTIGTTLSVTPVTVAQGGTVTVSMSLTTTQAINNVTPNPLIINGGAGSCGSLSPTSANVTTGSATVFTFSCTLNTLGEFSFSGDATSLGGYTFAEGLSNTVLVSKSGSANVVTWDLGSNTAGTTGIVIATGSLPTIYATQGNSAKFWSYLPSTNSWSDTPADLANNVKDGGSLAYDGTNVFALRGDNQKTTYKYTIGSPGSWATQANTSDGVEKGGSLVYLDVSGTKYLYALLGNSKLFRRYNIATNTWENRADTPENVKEGGALATDGTYIYATRGDDKTDFWRCNTTTTGVAGACNFSWETRASVPSTVKWGGALRYLSGYVYALAGDNTRNFYRYDPVANTWTARALTPGNVQDGGALTTDGTYLYAFQGKTNAFWRYDPTANTWSVLATAPGAVDQGGALTFVPGSGTADTTVTMSATPTVRVSGDQITVKSTLFSKVGATNQSPGTLNQFATGGATASCGPAVPATQNIPANGSAQYTWTCTLTAGTSAGSIYFTADPDGAGTAWAAGASNSVIIIQPLQFRVTVNPGSGLPKIENIATISGGTALTTVPSNKVETSLGASIGDFIWDDLDGDGLQDAGEPGIGGVQVILNGPGCSPCTTTTDAFGLYKFPGLTPGAYTVSYNPATTPANYLATTPSTLNATLVAGQQYNNADFGLRLGGTGSVGDTVWIDADEDGVVDVGETRLPNITVKLYKDHDNDGNIDSGDIFIGQTTTDASGLYQFNGLLAGNYLVLVDETSVVTTTFGVNTTIAAAMELVSGKAGNIINPVNPAAVNLPANNSVVTNADFGYNWIGQIGDYAWYDNNGDTIQDNVTPPPPDEGGAPNTTVVLYYDVLGDGIIDAAQDPILDVQTTGPSGTYLFDNLPPGTYIAKAEEQQVPAPPSSPHAGLIGYMVSTTGTEYVTALSAGDMTDYNADFGFIEAAEVKGHVWWDVNHSGVRDVGEPGLGDVSPSAGVLVTLSGTDLGGNPVLMTVYTDDEGEYEFIVPPSNAAGYTISYSTPDVLAIDPTLTEPTTPLTINVTVSAGQELTGLDFGVDNPGTVGDLVWSDANSNGVRDPGEPGLPDVTVQLYDSGGTILLATTTTDASGGYLFQGLPDGTFIVRVDPGTVPINSDQTGDPDEDGIPCSTCDNQGTATVSGGGSDLTLDFGYKVGGAAASTIALSGVVWDDNGDGPGTPENGVQDGIEPGIPGVTVDVVCDTGIYQAVTDGNGDWMVSGILSGSNCTVTVDESTLPDTAYYQTGDPDESSPPKCTVCDAETSFTNLTADESNIDFGYAQDLGSITGKVCASATGALGTGPCDDATETPLVGVTVTLTYAGPDNILGTADDVTTQTTTNGSGVYTFSDLNPGLYRIVETNPVGYTSLGDRDGGNPDVINRMSAASIPLLLGENAVNRNFEDVGPPSMQVVKKLSNPLGGTAQETDAVVYSIVITNTGTNPMTSMTVVDEYDAAFLTFDSATPAVNVQTSGVLTWTTNLNPSLPLAPNAAMTITVNFTALAETSGEPGGVTTNTVTASGKDDLNRDVGPNTDEAPVEIVPVTRAAIGDLVWYDADSDGIQDVGEPGIANVTVRLYRDDGDGVFEPGTHDILVDETITDADGGYLFHDAKAGAYFVDVVTTSPSLTGLTFVTGPQSADEPHGVFTVADGDTYRDADFAFVKEPGPGNVIIGDRVWVDVNGDGKQDPGEPGLPGVTVTILNSSNVPIGSAVTDSNGIYRIEVPAGNGYKAAPVTPGGYTPTTTQPRLLPDLSPGDQYLDADFGYNRSGLKTIAGLVFEDAANNGVYDTGSDNIIAAVTVDLIRDTNNNGVWDAGEPTIATVTTSSAADSNDNNYSFVGLTSGRYLVRVSDTQNVLNNFEVGNLGTPGADDNSQAQPYAIDLTVATSNLTADFGYNRSGAISGGAPTGIIGNQIWHDLDGDGLYEPANSEPGISGVTVDLYSGGVLVATTTTGAAGNYVFTDLASGTYTVTVSDNFNVLAGYLPTLNPTPGADNSNQVDPYTVVLPDGGFDFTADFGYALPVTIGDFIYLDSNGNGVQDPSETTGIGSGVPVTLTDAVNNVISTTIAGPTGYYTFTNILPGTFKVIVPSTISGVTLTSVNPINVTLISGQTYLDADFGYIAPTAVGIVSFTAMAEAAGVRLYWQTSLEQDLDGFVVLRSTAIDGAYKAISDLIPAMNDPSGASYEWLDTSVDFESLYWYRLQAQPDGEIFGPIPGREDPGSGGSNRLFVPFIVR
ncbi:MAG: DUF11 domain-containing protein [Caldilineales bacterium]|nr:DUF11 domain-containing protein [Caldilineales bacterium]